MSTRLLHKRLQLVFSIISMLLVLISIPLASAIPTPLGIDGTIYDLDGITPVWKDTKYSVTNLDTGEMVSSSAGRGSAGRYSATMGGNNGDILLIQVWNKYNAANFTIPANGVIHNAHIVLNMTYPPLAPVFMTKSQDLLLATERVPFSFAIRSFDDNDDPVSFWLLEGPKGMAIHYDTGIIEWVPTDAHIGNNTFTLSLFDGIHFTNETFSLQVIGVNDAPVFTSLPQKMATLGKDFVYRAESYDAENDALSFALVTGPSNAAISAQTGILEWRPQGSQKGDHAFTIQVSDGEFNTTQSFVVTVSTSSETQIRAGSGGGGGSSGASVGKPIPGQLSKSTGSKNSADININPNTLLSEEELASVLSRLKVQDVLVMPETQNSLVNILAQRPTHVAPVQSKVYRYLQIENPNQAQQQSHLISFRLEKEWLNNSHIASKDVSLQRYVDGAWTHLATSSVSEDGEFAYFLSETPGFSYFAITVREGVDPAYSFVPESSKLKQPYTILGTAFSFLRVWQVGERTPMVLENLNTSELLEFYTGVGESKGGYVGTLNGEKGQMVRVSLNGHSIVIELGEDSLIVVDFIKRIFGEGYVAVERGGAGYRVVSSLFTLFLIMSLSLLITVMIQRRFEKERRRMRQEGQMTSSMEEKRQSRK